MGRDWGPWGGTQGRVLGFVSVFFGCLSVTIFSLATAAFRVAVWFFTAVSAFFLFFACGLRVIAFYVTYYLG